MPKQLIALLLTLALTACTDNPASAPSELVSTESPSSTVSIVSTSVSKNPLTAGETQSASVTLTSAAALQELIVDIRLYDSANNRHARKEFFPVSIPAGSQVTLTFDFPSPSDLPPGQYNVQIGVWDTSWNTLLYETRDPFTVIAPSTTPQVSIVSTSVSENPLVAGELQWVSVTLTSTATLQDLIIDIRIYDAANNRHARKEFFPVSIQAGSQRVLTFDYSSPPDLPPGQYNVQIGVWDTSWKTWLYETRSPFTVTVTPFVMNCQDGARLAAGSYVVENNQWGRGNIVDFSQCVANGGVAANGSVSARWTWNWPAQPPGEEVSEVKGYPAIVFGQKPGYTSTPNSNLPIRVDSLSQLTSAWSTRSTYTGRGQLTFDLWLTRDGVPRNSFPETPITHEIMVVVEPYGNYGLDRNSGWFVEEITINGIRYKTYKADDFPPVGTKHWRFLVFQMLAPMPHGDLDFKPLFDYLKSRRFIQGDEYLSSIEFGSEPVEGTGDVIVDSFKATVR